MVVLRGTNDSLRNAYRTLVGRPEENRPPVKPRYRWEANIEVCLNRLDMTVWTGIM